MITVTRQKKRGSYLWAVIVVSVFVHFGFYSYAPALQALQRTVYGSSKVEFNIEKPEPPKEEPPPPPPPPPKPKPKPKEEPQPVSNTEAKPAEPPPEPPPEVFGVTQDSLVGDSSVSVRQGNTLGKEMEKKFTEAKDIKQLMPKKELVPVKASQVTRLPSFKTRVKPAYPPKAREAGIEGVVLLKVTINERGRVVRIRLLQRLGYGCDEAAIDMMKKAVFVPAYQGDKPVPIEIKIPVRFQLED